MTARKPAPDRSRLIPALLPRGEGHQFVIYADSCSGIPNAPHERTFAEVNAVVARLQPPPSFVVFPGDEIAGLAADPSQLTEQWRYWLDVEMAWLDRRAIPLWHTTGNHTTYDRMSEAVFRATLGLPPNGPPGQEGLSYWIRRDDLLLVCVHTSWSGLGGEGHLETDWLRQVLLQHADARYKLVAGHHPVFPVNGFSGAYAREIGPEHASVFWDVLVASGVLAYLCSHILAFDVQVHRGVLQLLTAGAGTAHRMPEGIEYLHCVQAAIDPQGFRYQVLDTAGRVREQLAWPPQFPPLDTWAAVPPGESHSPIVGRLERPTVFRFAGCAAPAGTSVAQTLLCAFDPAVLAPLWVGLRGPEQRLIVTLAPEPRRSPHYWIGPALTPGEPFDFQLLIHPGMGPGGIACRSGLDPTWSSLAGISAWGPERLDWPSHRSVGHAQAGPHDQRFQGTALAVAAMAG